MVDTPEFPNFKPELKGNRWFVAVSTGCGPNSHIGDFDPEAEAREWIRTKSSDWPPSKPKAEPDLANEGEPA